VDKLGKRLIIILVRDTIIARELAPLFFLHVYQEKKNVLTTCQWCQRRANGANDVPTVSFLHIQKFNTKFSIISAN
jgi:glycerol-3-phosphate cytidylyltransferase-like family protein